MLPEEIKVVHSLPGRCRLKIPVIKNNKHLASRLVRELVSVPGISRITANVHTASVLVTYEAGRIVPRDFAGEFYRAFQSVFPGGEPDEKAVERLSPFFTPSASQPQGSTIMAQIISEECTVVNEGIRKVMGGYADLGLFVPLALALLGIWRLKQYQRVPLPPWWTLFWYSFGTFKRLNS
jgi:hypothetical protein